MLFIDCCKKKITIKTKTMGTKKVDKLALWLAVLHKLEDTDTKDIKAVHKILKELNTKYYIKQRS